MRGQYLSFCPHPLVVFAGGLTGPQCPAARWQVELLPYLMSKTAIQEGIKATPGVSHEGQDLSQKKVACKMRRGLQASRLKLPGLKSVLDLAGFTSQYTLILIKC